MENAHASHLRVLSCTASAEAQKPAGMLKVAYDTTVCWVYDWSKGLIVKGGRVESTEP